MKVLIVDDHPIARRGLRTVLREGLGVEDCAEAPDAMAALAIAPAYRPDLVLLDMRIPGPLPAPELCRHLRAALPKTQIVLVTAFDNSSEIRDCLVAGADACLLKDTSEVDMTASLQAVIAGESVVDQRIAMRLARDLVDRPAVPAGPRLTGRELDVLDLLAEGCSNRSIADRLHLSETTVKGYVSSLLEKLEAK